MPLYIMQKIINIFYMFNFFNIMPLYIMIFFNIFYIYNFSLKLLEKTLKSKNIFNLLYIYKICFQKKKKKISKVYFHVFIKLENYF